MRLAQVVIKNLPASSQFNNYNTLAAAVVSRFLLYAISLAGVFFFVRLILAGFNIITTSGDPAKLQAANQQIINSAIGLLIVVVSFFAAQIAEAVLGINIL